MEDVNGDGMADIVAISNSNVHYMLSDGTEFVDLNTMSTDYNRDDYG